jgi:hypothetical protein
MKQEPDPEPISSSQERKPPRAKEVPTNVSHTAGYFTRDICACPPRPVKGQIASDSQEQLPIDAEIPHFPRHAKKPYNDIRYSKDHTLKGTS